jgi:putative Mg2+ transporter-C (MgtC) family protein
MLGGEMGDLLTDPVHREALERLVIALVLGGLIGLERSYHGRPAGFRTHALVCLSTSLLMLLSTFGLRWMPDALQARITLDPTRMAQGIMTGIGFLGAGAIMRDGLSVRGLTTAASIWVTASIGILVGIGFYFPALLTAVLTLGTLSLFRWIERLIPAQFNAHLRVCFRREAAPPEPELRRLCAEHGFRVTNLQYHLNADHNFFEYQMTIQSRRGDRVRIFSETLSKLEALKEFQITPSGD